MPEPSPWERQVNRALQDAFQAALMQEPDSNRLDAHGDDDNIGSDSDSETPLDEHDELQPVMHQPLASGDEEEDPLHTGPFQPAAHANLSALLLTVYATVAWLNLKFHLPPAACNTLLVVLRGLILLLCCVSHGPSVDYARCGESFLGINLVFYQWPVYPTCREVYPATGSTPKLWSVRRGRLSEDHI